MLNLIYYCKGFIRYTKGVSIGIDEDQNKLLTQLIIEVDSNSLILRYMFVSKNSSLHDEREVVVAHRILSWVRMIY